MTCLYVFYCPNSRNSQKYYKLRKESVKLYNGIPILTPPTTPAKRKASINDDEEMKHQTPTKRAKKSVKKEEALELELSSDYNNLSSYPMYQNRDVQIPFSPYGIAQMPMNAEEGNGFLVGSENN